MIQTLTLSPGVTLRYHHDTRFKQGRLSMSFLMPMARETAALNAMVPAVLLRGTQNYPDLRDITLRLYDLYGATVSDVVRRSGDYQAVGFYCGFVDDRFALPGDRILAPVVDFLRQILLEPLTEQDIFRRDHVEQEKESLIRYIASTYDSKSRYAMNRLFETMCAADSFGVAQMGTEESVAAVTAEKLWAHYQDLLHHKPVNFFYVGSASLEEVADLLRPIFGNLEHTVEALPPQTPFCDGGISRIQEEQGITQSILTLGFTTPITMADPRHAAMRVLNLLFGSGMTSKLFLNVREALSLCYSIGSDYYGTKGIMTVFAGIDGDQKDRVRQEILAQLEACCRGDISPAELEAAKATLRSELQAVHDSPAAIDGYYTAQVNSGHPQSVTDYRTAVDSVTAADVAAAARTLQEHSEFFLKGVAR